MYSMNKFGSDYHACLRLYDMMGKAGVLPDDTTALYI
ncbi:hypothetical protein CASFOL_024194 [Castilleja foliolosa]|uniref:Pentatricopeptide repeat-containing protein n=1 Tax=Castilleja foliolosa TaxID=1961234 RepID=A0ABD3CR57_9LAMI